MQFPVQARLKDGTPVVITQATEADVPAFQALYGLIVQEGWSYPHQRPLTREETYAYWFEGKTTIGAFLDETEANTELLGGFYLKPNWPGRARFVANAGFMVAPHWRRKGLGWLLGALMLRHARDMGYRGVIFNLVFSQNHIARALWEKLGFVTVGVIPQAIVNDDGTCQDAIMMYRSLIADPGCP
ncbi:MAG: N-acetyltransferase [Nitrospirae bacterium]|nr:MAG: N-acetyltransferase [Nitrospirota bacterium]